MDDDSNISIPLLQCRLFAAFWAHVGVAVAGAAAQRRAGAAARKDLVEVQLSYEYCDTKTAAEQAAAAAQFAVVAPAELAALHLPADVPELRQTIADVPELSA